MPRPEALTAVAQDPAPRGPSANDPQAPATGHVRSQRDLWSGLMFVGVGVVFAVGATGYAFGSGARPGPGYFPFGLGILLAVLGAVVALKALVAGDSDGGRIGTVAWRPLALIVGSVVLFGLLLPVAGLFVSLPILVIVSSLGGDEFRWRPTLASALVLIAFSWAVFIWGLGLTIPLWPSIGPAAN